MQRHRHLVQLPQPLFPPLCPHPISFPSIACHPERPNPELVEGEGSRRTCVLPLDADPPTRRPADSLTRKPGICPDFRKKECHSTQSPFCAPGAQKMWLFSATKKRPRLVSRRRLRMG